jgi:hypothetical protein
MYFWRQRGIAKAKVDRRSEGINRKTLKKYRERGKSTVVFIQGNDIYIT